MEPFDEVSFDEVPFDEVPFDEVSFKQNKFGRRCLSAKMLIGQDGWPSLSVITSLVINRHSDPRYVRRLDLRHLQTLSLSFYFFSLFFLSLFSSLVMQKDLNALPV